MPLDSVNKELIISLTSHFCLAITHSRVFVVDLASLLTMCKLSIITPGQVFYNMLAIDYGLLFLLSVLSVVESWSL